MNVFGNKKKNNSRFGYSKYDDNGNVIYSENRLEGLGHSIGPLCKHYYKYDDRGRRIFYKEVIVYDDGTLFTRFEETKTYRNNGTVFITRTYYDTFIYCTELVNSMGRELYSKTIDMTRHTSTERVFNFMTNRYDVKHNMEFFIPNLPYQMITDYGPFVDPYFSDDEEEY